MGSPLVGGIEGARVHDIAVGNWTHLSGFDGDDIKGSTICAEKFQFVTLMVAMNHHNDPQIACFQVMFR